MNFELRTSSFRAASAVLLLTASVSAHPRPSDWAMFRGNPHGTGVAAGELAVPLKVVWKAELGEPVVSTAAIVDGVVYVGADDEALHTFDLATGKELWTYKAKGAVRAGPTVMHGVAYFGDQDGMMHAVDVKTGEAKWTFATEAEIVSGVSLDEGDERLVFGSYDSHVYCLSAAEGKLLWKFQTGGRVHGTPAIVEGMVVAAGCDEALHVLKLSDGISQARISMGSVSGASAAIMGSQVFVGTYGHEVLCLDWKKGERVWRFEDPDRQFPILSSAAVSEKVVIVGGRDKRIRGLDPSNGELRWTLVTGGKVDSSPVIVGSRAFAASGDGNLYAVDAASGAEVWRFESGAPFSASPAIGGKRLVIGNEDGVIFCFGPNESAARTTP